MGATGPQVRRVQRVLLHLGYPIGAADGKFGVRTQRGVIAFQSASELPIDGVVAANTWAALERRSEGMEEPEKAPSRPEARPMPLIPPEPPVTEPACCPLPMRETRPAPMVEPPSVAQAVPEVQPPIRIAPLMDWSAASVQIPMEAVSAPEPVVRPMPEPGRPWTQIEPAVETLAPVTLQTPEPGKPWTKIEIPSDGRIVDGLIRLDGPVMAE